MGMKKKTNAPCHGMANLLVDICEDALQGFADAFGGALAEMSSDRGGLSPPHKLFESPCGMVLDPTEQDLGGDGVHNTHSFGARFPRVRATSRASPKL